MKLRLFLILTSLSLLFSCKKNDVSIKLIEHNLNEERPYLFDYSNAYEQGFVVPSLNSDGISSFNVSFKIEGFNEDTLYYKLFYQNESYKFVNEFSHENFYGCSESTLEGFNKVGVLDGNIFIINDSIIIKGNPRNEQKYISANEHSLDAIDTSGLYSTMNQIKNDTTWYKSIIEKAEKNARTPLEQIEIDALWMLSNNLGENTNNNNRWQRNPRTGDYSIFLVVTNKTGATKTPKYITNTTLKSGENYINPYNYFNSNLYTTLLIDSFVTIKATVPIDKGIYIPYSKFNNKDYYNQYVGDNQTFYSQAAFEIQETSLHQKTISNIPLKAKFLTENYTKEEYFSNIEKYKDKRFSTKFVNTEAPGKTFGVDILDTTLWFKNPYYEHEYKKENVGIKTRHGLTYGKYTFKIKMANLLSKSNVWTGLTNALWLVKESDQPWNNRRICEGEGFMPFYGAGKGEQRVPKISYSEIDFEILKTAQVWPKTSYQDKKERTDPASNDDKVMVTCTNWDMACQQPKEFGIGEQEIIYQGNSFYPHRWDEYYNALTSKSPQKDTELFSGDYYYFQIEWKPTEIIWRIGPSKNQLRVVGYMNDLITTIPNNQMIAVITQEYHFAEWWPKSPYKQENIPFPGEDLKGRLYSLEIE